MNDLRMYCYACMSRLPEADCVCPHCGHDNHVRSADQDCLPATVLAGQYYIGKPLGRGGFGVTYIGLDKGLNRLVAVKEFYPASIALRDHHSQTLQFRTGSVEDFRHGCERALEEGRLAAQMGRVPGVVQLYNAFEANGTVYIVMEYIKGRTLAQVIRQEGKLGWQRTYELMEPLMHTLSTIHGMKVVHRDVSPDNIMIRDDDGSAVLLDFGAAHVVSDRTMGEHSISLRMGYAPIEQYSAMGKQDGRIDEYALCATMYHALTGQRPPDATERAFGGTELAKPRSLGSDIPVNAENALMRGLALKADDRFDTVEDLRAVLAGEKIAKKKAGKKQSGKGPAIAVVAVVLALAAAGLFLLPKDQPQPGVQQPAADGPAATAAPVVTAAPAYSGKQEVALGGVLYRLTDTGYEVAGCEGDPAVLVIPAQVEGIPVTSVGKNAFEKCTLLKSIELPEGLTTIGEYAFYGCSGLKSVVLPDSITTMGKAVFYQCDSLSTVNLPAGLTTISPHLFGRCVSLESITLPGGITSIGDWAFEACSLKSINLPEGVTSIGEAAFAVCEKLESINLPEGLTTIGKNAFNSCRALESIIVPGSVTNMATQAFCFAGVKNVVINEGVTAIPVRAFVDCNLLETVTLPDSVTEIGTDAFSVQSYEETKKIVFRCPRGSYAWNWALENGYKVEAVGGVSASILKNARPEVTQEGLLYKLTDTGYEVSGYEGEPVNLEIPAEVEGIPVTSVGKWAFRDCTSLKSVVLPQGVTTLNAGAFLSCKKLQSVTLPEGLVTLGVEAFRGCEDLESIDLPSTLKETGFATFAECEKLNGVVLPDGLVTLGSETFLGCKDLESITIPAGVKKLESFTFGECSRLASVVLPEGLTVLGSDVFNGCKKLKHIDIPAGVTEIGSGAFRESGIVSITLPEGLESIEDDTFAICENLVEVNIPASVTEIGEGAFSSCKLLKSITLPEGLETIEAQLFFGCDSLEEVNIPAGVTEIGEQAFCDCGSLKSITIPVGVEELESQTIWSCDSLESVVLPEGLKSIGSEGIAHNYWIKAIYLPASLTEIHETAFTGNNKDAVYYCPQGSYAGNWAKEHGLTVMAVLSGAAAEQVTVDGILYKLQEDGSYAVSGYEDKPVHVVIPERINGKPVTSVNEGAFEKCTSLKSVTLPEGLTSIGLRAFESCDDLESISLPSSLKKIDSNAFRFCEKLKSVALPEGLTSLGNAVFTGCEDLESITIPAGVRALGRYMFHECTSLQSVTLPEGLESIGEGAFDFCKKLKHITIPASVTTIHENAFMYASGQMVIHCPEGSYAWDWAKEHGLTVMAVPGGTAAEQMTVDGVQAGAPEAAAAGNPGAVTLSGTGVGFMGLIHATVTFDGEGRILSVNADVSNDTMTIARACGEPAFLDSFVGKTLPVEVDAVSGATLTSRGVMQAVNNTSQAETLEAAYRLQNGETMDAPQALSGEIVAVNTVWSPDYQNITVTIVCNGRTDMPIMCYRLTGEGADRLKVGDYITVMGVIKNYKGTIEFDRGCQLVELGAEDMISAQTLYEQGVNFSAENDHEKAAACFLQAARMGHTEAMYRIGLCYSTGEGVAQDKRQGAAWYRQSAEKGSFLGMNAWGLCLKLGEGVAKDEQQAVYWYERSAEGGIIAAMYNLGVHYFYTDEAEARRWFTMAAAGNDGLKSRAEEQLADLADYWKNK